jgi:hypothetical protein
VELQILRQAPRLTFALVEGMLQASLVSKNLTTQLSSLKIATLLLFAGDEKLINGASSNNQDENSEIFKKMATVVLIMFIKKALYIRSPENTEDCKQIAEVLSQQKTVSNNVFRCFIELALEILKSQFKEGGLGVQDNIIPAINILSSALIEQDEVQLKNTLNLDDVDSPIKRQYSLAHYLDIQTISGISLHQSFDQDNALNQQLFDQLV